MFLADLQIFIKLCAVFSEQGVLKIVPHQCGYCGGAARSISSFLIQLRSIGRKLEFVTLFLASRHSLLVFCGTIKSTT